ncbi:MAG: hypothetical protein ACYS47_06900 [Planctomycetota bacterium]|jgi:hypothetical protein
MDPVYRRPREYIPPYNYCDRWCERCDIDKEKCLLYQSGVEEELEAISLGKETRTMEYTVERITESLKDTLAMLEEEAKERGIDLSNIEEEAKALGEEEDPPIVKKALDFSVDIHRFLQENELALDAVEGEMDLESLHWHHNLVGPKIGRIEKKYDPDDPEEPDPELEEFSEASDILTAQIVHRSLIETERGLLQIIKHLPSLTDTVIDFLARAKGFRDLMEERWLSRENGLLEPVGGGPWWGPLEDAQEALRNLREVRARRKAREGEPGSEGVRGP